MSPLRFFFFFNDTATTEIYTLSLHDALPISSVGGRAALRHAAQGVRLDEGEDLAEPVQRDGFAHEVGRAQVQALARLALGGDAGDGDDRHAELPHEAELEEVETAHAR